MEKDTLYKVKSTKECIAYIKKAGLTIDDDAGIPIKSQSGIVYVLPNKEVVLVPANFDLNYPGIIFKNKEAFENFAEQDFFPIGEENMTWLERNNNRIKDFGINQEFFSKILTEDLHIKFDFENMNDVKSAFLKIHAIVVNKKSNNTANVENYVYSFGFALISYLKKYQNFQLLMLTEYENYNPYQYPMMVKDDKRINVLSKVIRYMNSSNPHSFENLFNSLGTELK